MAGVSEYRYLETEVREALRRALESDARFADAFRRLLYNESGKPYPTSAKEWRLERREFPAAFGGRIDLLMTSGKHALGVETKVWDGEKLFQYIAYPKTLRDLGYTVCFVGIVGRIHATRGRHSMLQLILDRAADARITWAHLLGELAKALPGSRTAASFRHDLNKIAPSLLTVAPRANPPQRRSARRALHLLASEPEELAAFFFDVSDKLGSAFQTSPFQAGNSPISLSIGRPEWADWFEDPFATRVHLSCVTSSSFRLRFMLWEKNRCEARMTKPLRIKQSAQHLANLGFEITRNLPGKHGREQLWLPPFIIPPTGFFYANTSPPREFCLPYTDALQLGWDGTVESVVERVRRLGQIVDSLVEL